jgi:translation initiation factor IF-2
MADEVQTTQAIAIPAVITVGDFASAIGLPVTKVIGELMKNGVMASINEQIDYDTAAIIASDLGVEVEPEAAPEPEVSPERIKLAAGEGEERPPIVTAMGHVDHGKTSLLDAIRSTSVVSKEAGGITQHIGAYQVKRNERWITFLDTPGHAAFSAIRTHGASMTDVAIIVVAADDGVKPQTKESIKIAQDAGVQIVVAINKVDKEGADPVRVRQELSELGLTAEEWGGNVPMVDVSAKTGLGLEKLLDVVLLVADIEELRAIPDGQSEGFIVESHLDAGKGPVATVLVRNGILRAGDVVVSGSTYAKVRSLGDFRGKRITSAHPGMPAVVTGFKSVPAFGDMYRSVPTEKEARDLASKAIRTEQTKTLRQVKKIDAAQLTDAISAGNIKELNVVVKADVQGSLESLLEALSTLRNDEVAIKVVSSAVGDVSESDINFAKTANALLLGFGVSMATPLRVLANRDGVQVKMYRVIYELIDDLREALSQLLEPEVIETTAAELEILGVFKTTKASTVCGGKVTMGKVEKGLKMHIMRGKEEIGEGHLTSLQKDKQETKEVFEGELCGMSVSSSTPIEIGDKLVFFTTESKARTL